MIAGIQRKWVGCATLPQSIYTVNNPTNPADPANGSHAAYIANLDVRSDFGKANPRNTNSPNSGAYVHLPVYNLYV